MSIRLSESEQIPFGEASSDPAFADVVDWIVQFLCAPHADVGRLGDVCPFARSAVLRKSIAFFSNWSADADAFEQEVAAHREDFGQSGGMLDTYRCRIIVPMRIANAAHAVERVQQRLKPSFVERHLMIGQFFPGCEEPGLWNRSFRPLQAPVPLLAIRNMVPTDIAFLYDNAHYVRLYLEKFGGRGRIALRQLETAREAKA